MARLDLGDKVIVNVDSGEFMKPSHALYVAKQLTLTVIAIYDGFYYFTGEFETRTKFKSTISDLRRWGANFNREKYNDSYKVTRIGIEDFARLGY